MRGTVVGLLFVGICQAAQVYLNPRPSLALPSRLSPKHASLVLSLHLGLEQFEVIEENAREYNYLLDERSFVGEGSRNALLLTVHDSYLNDILPSSLQPSFSLSSNPSSISSLISKFIHRASHAYDTVYSELLMPKHGVPRILDIFSAPSAINELFLSEMTLIVNFLESSAAQDGRFAALELRGLSEFSPSSEQYKLAADTLRAVLETSVTRDDIVLVLIAYNPLAKRQPEPQPPPQSPFPLPQLPIGAVSTCFNTTDACQEGTYSCSGRGQCVKASKANMACYVCSCSATTNEQGNTEYWAGESCERKDISGPFVLITGTVVTLILLIAASVSLLFTVGEKELPSILTGGVSSSIRKDQ